MTATIRDRAAFHGAHRLGLCSRKTIWGLAFLLQVSFLGQGMTFGQVLARPGWAGSGVAPQPWWRSAVIYRLDPSRFQDSDGDGVGDLPGVTQRLDYLQSLGVDAVLLDLARGLSAGSSPASNAQAAGESEAGLDDLVRSASDHHLRVLMAISPALQNGSQPALLDLVHHWLSLGVAGVFLPKPPLRSDANAAAAEVSYVALREALRGVLRGMPGERLLLVDPAPDAAGSTSPAGRVAGRTDSPIMLTTAALLPAAPADAVALRSSLLALAANDAPERVGLLRFAGRPHTGSADAVAEAAALLGSRGAVILDFGEEIGLDTAAPGMAAMPGSAVGSGMLPVMQWTPGNIQRPAPAPIERRPAAPGSEYGPYRPYIHPPPTVLTGPAPKAPRVTVDGDIPAALPDADTLPGFTTGTLPVPPVEGERLNVATQERDPHSTLAAFRQLIALHHGDPAIRSGAEVVVPTSDASTVVWLRRKPAGSVLGSEVLGAINLGDQAVVVNLDSALARLGAHPGSLRALFSYAASASLTGETTGSLRLPPHSAFLGEWTHTGSRR